MRTLFFKDNFECHFVNLLSFTQQLFSSQLEINHVIQQLNIMGEKTYLSPKLCGNSTFALDRAISEP